ncbi:MAG TPA: DMT family transporter, partial [Myxococcota bacterium]
MARSSLIRLFALAALWGGSFLFIRIAAHDIPAPLLMFARAAVAAIILFVVGGLPARDAKTIKHLFIVGITNSAVPFVLIAVAAHTLGASVCSVLNASSPAFAALIGALVARTLPSLRTSAGLAIGLIGVAITASSAIESSSSLASVDATRAILAALASIGAAVCYGIAGVYTKRANVSVSPMHTSSGSMGAAAVALAVPALWAVVTSSSSPSEHAFGTPGEWGAVLALAILCTA